MLDLAGADAEGQRPQRAMRRGVAVAADQRGAGQREALFGPDNMHDPLPRIERIDIGHAELGDIAPQRRELAGAGRVRDRQRVAGGIDARRGRQIVIGHREGKVGAAHRAIGRAEAGKGLRAGDFVDEVPIDIDQAGAIVPALDDMVGPDLLVQGAGFTRHAHALIESCADASFEDIFCRRAMLRG